MKQTRSHKQLKKKVAPKKGQESPSGPPSDSQVILYPAWCKRCGNCAAFCPRKVLEMDEWGYPQVAHPERCVTCHMCEMLCPDFAITVGEYPPSQASDPAKRGTSRREADARGSLKQSPERVAPEPAEEETDGG